MITFPKSAVDRFYTAHWPNQKGKQRLGQAFFDYMKLDKTKEATTPTDGSLSEEKIWLDRLYQADGSRAKAMIAERIDVNN